MDKQKNQSNNLRSNVDDDNSTNQDDVENLKRNIEFSDNYMKNNKGHMKQSDLENLKEKQEHRKEQLEQLDDF